MAVPKKLLVPHLNVYSQHLVHLSDVSSQLHWRDMKETLMKEIKCSVSWEGELGEHGL